ncbi:MAG: restriction endonuclease subunit S [Candidatus Thiodiazotropha taylori]|nr:restriction endonuclease subunit S [Candidatus Thiodiazotropha taylori]MCW4250750.1 restriction endonuclease subunit S [Candidatus Thiodiazotropha endolucinida]MCG8073707.1 restriction endonuclease subunit S [Candidatus Thiodiazotropha taylori]MCG8113277.1 restriction endonuclease subunit S [Candidatus Thiodiazotropha taylori]MCW4285638.1 restriction endonuclease subunit S [Candidatus Thiodiazotropha taylori]
MNDEKKGLVPRLRFPEFRGAGEWMTVPLEKLATRRTTRNRDGKLGRVLTNSAEHGVVDQREYFDKDIATQGNLENYFVVDINDFVYNPRISAFAPVGPISRNGVAKGVMSPLYTVFRFNNPGNDFYAHYFKSSAWHSYMREVGSTGARHDRMAVSNADFLAMPLPVPSPEEQQKIADCLFCLDDLIGAQADKLDALKTYKKGLMQQLFPREGETVPRQRFPEFREAGEWESTKLGDIASIRSGSTPLRSNSSFYSGGDIPWVKTTDLNNSFIYATEECITPVSKPKINPVGSVLVAMYGGFNQIGRTGLLKVSAATNQALSVLNANRNKVLPIYLLMWLNAKVEVWKRIASSSRKDPNITGSDVASFPISFPSAEEQQKIADCLSSFDGLIAAQEDKIDALKNHRKGLMQQLFLYPEDMDA